MINNVVIVLGGQQRNSAIHVYMYPVSPKLLSHPGWILSFLKWGKIAATFWWASHEDEWVNIAEVWFSKRYNQVLHINWKHNILFKMLIHGRINKMSSLVQMKFWFEKIYVLFRKKFITSGICTVLCFLECGRHFCRGWLTNAPLLPPNQRYPYS